MKARRINTDFDGKHPALDGTFSRIQPRNGASDHLQPSDTIVATTENPENTESVSHDTMLTLHAIMASLAPSVFVKDASEATDTATASAPAGGESSESAADLHLFI